jgi:hypothetical protein
MMKYTFFIFFSAISFFSTAQTKVSLADVGKHIGKTVTVTGKMVDGRYLDKSKSKLTLLNLGAAFPNQLLTIVIQDENRGNFSYKPEDVLKNKTVTVTGKVTEFNDKPQITISTPSEINYDINEPSGIIEAPRQRTPVEEDNMVFTKVEEPAQYPGGIERWKDYLNKNLNGQVAADDNAKKGIYTIKVQFIVDRQGMVSDVRAIEATQGCPSCINEAVRVVKKVPYWIPAKQNGKVVNYQAVQYISFQVLN